MENAEDSDDRFSFSPVELLVLEDRWNKGKLNDYVPLVRKFIDAQQEKIKKELGPNANDDRLARTFLKLLLENGTLDHASEMLEQKQEILREIWICAERGDFDRRRITDQWIRTHAPEWRRWRVLVYSFIAVKIAVQIYRDIDT
jgi:frataxin-like iron-binding protein CyaY